MMDKREFKTHPQQWKVVVDFLEEHPMLVKGNFTSSDGDYRRIATLWEELAQRLNCMGFGERNVEKWKAAIGRWRSKTKAKASLLRTEGEKTGGGPSKAVSLNETEERLLQLVGWKAVTGDGNMELGMGKNIQEKFVTQVLPSTSSNPLPPVQPEPIACSSTASPPPLAQLSQQSSPRKRSRLTTDKSRKMVTMTQMHQEQMKELREIRQSLATVANSHREIAADIKTLVNFMTKKE